MKNSKKNTAAKVTKQNTLSAASRAETDNRAEDQARAQLASIVEMVAAMRAADNADDDDQREAAREAIESDPLSVEVRQDWHSVGAKPEDTACEFRILLCTGGPAVQIVGELNEHSEPERARLQFQDWFTPWQDLRGVSAEDEAALLDYCRVFYFGE